MDVRIATLNIFGYPSSFLGNSRNAQDHAMIGELIKRLDADVIVFQEIIDLEELERLLSGLVPGREYRLKDDAEHWIASAVGGNGMKVVMAFDRNRLKPLEAGKAKKAGPGATGGKRDCVAARLSPAGGGKSLTVIGVHFKSGLLTVPPRHEPEDDTRVEEVNNLIDWIESLSPILPGVEARPAGEPTVLIGDFNAVRGNISVEPILSGARLKSWLWAEPDFTSSLSPTPVSNIPAGEHWTTFIDKAVIDHVLLSPEIEPVEGPWVYVFEYDPTWLAAADVTQEWMRKVEYVLTTTDDEGQVTTEDKENLFRITDHRPVRITVNLD